MKVIVPDNLIHRLQQEVTNITQKQRATGRTTEMLKMLISGDVVVAANGGHRETLKHAYNSMGLSQDVDFVTYEEYRRLSNFNRMRRGRVLYDHYTVEYLTKLAIENLHREFTK